jgi:hypothetical protein
MMLLKKIGIILFVVGIFSTTEMVHFAGDLSGMIAHYEDHNNEHESVGFLEFLTDHFNHQDRQESEHPGHNDFPFHRDHSSTCCSPLLTFIPLNNTLVFELPIPHFDVPRSANVSRYPQFSPSEFASSIWQPPQVS